MEMGELGRGLEAGKERLKHELAGLRSTSSIQGASERLNPSTSEKQSENQSDVGKRNLPLWSVALPND
jgi:hypothetical protein